MERAKSVSIVETARHIRRALKGRFPGVKFSVTCTPGTTIRVRWTDGPPKSTVRPLLRGYEGSGYEPQYECTYHCDSWLNPTTGEAAFARTAGGGLKNADQSPNPWPGVGILVSFGAGFVRADRCISRALIERVSAQVEPEFGHAPPPLESWGDGDKWETWHYKADPCSPSAWIWRHYADALEAFDAYEPPAQEPQAPTAPAQELADNGDGCEVKHERDWTWVYLQWRPGDHVRTALKGAGAQFSAKRTKITGAESAWYIKERADLADLSAAIRAAYWQDYRTEHPDLVAA